MLSSMEADRARLSKIEIEILDLQDSISVLRAEKQLVQRRLDSYKYPVLALPNEMVSEIFVHTLPPYPICPELFGTDSPTTLTHICRKWREIALDTPELWRAIRVWAKRSGSFPLSIHMGIERSQEIYPELLDRLARREHLTLNVYTPAILIIDDPMPLLRDLELVQHNMKISFELRDAPQLRSVVFRNFSAVTLPWQQLTHLTIDTTVANFLPILQQTTNLVHFKVTLWYPVPNEPGSDITLACLESLVVYVEQGPGTRFLTLLTVPALRSLAIQERCIRPDPVAYLTSFIAKSHCRLRILNITGIKRLIRSTYRTAFPSIPKLVFSRSNFTGDEDDSGDEEAGSESDGRTDSDGD
ncbi:hypothetical protein C8R45DRAFT_1152325 [Mycena sanguinolenta]|nr:hypothetical protein C8R45DRAFT_1152325 [Mycena sanguinolenta]